MLSILDDVKNELLADQKNKFSSDLSAEEKLFSFFVSILSIY